MTVNRAKQGKFGDIRAFIPLQRPALTPQARFGYFGVIGARKISGCQL
jgi:hypothetical protein